MVTIAEQGSEAAVSTLTATTEACICKAEEAAAEAKADIDRLEPCMAPLSTRHRKTTVPGVTRVKLFEELIELDVILAGHTIVTPLCGGIFED
eukprot:10250143-Ditylum_brightwellii.AAC.1